MLQWDNVAEYINKALDVLEQRGCFSGKHVIIYEFSPQAKVVAAYLKRKGISSVSLVDKDALNQEKQYSGLPIQAPEQVLRQVSDDAAVIVFDHGHEKRQEILNSNPSLEGQIYEINQFDYADFPCRLEIPAIAKPIGLYEAQADLFGLLNYFHEFCCKHKLRYFLDGGTLLGAARHQGFIPWDDDLDVTMPMPDYLKLCRLLSEDCDEQYEFRCLHAQKQEPLSLSSISRLLLRQVVTDSSHYPIHMMEGMGLDIWALAGFPDDEREQEAYSLELEYMGDYWKEQIVIPYGKADHFGEIYENSQSELLKKMTKYNYDECSYTGYAYCGKILHLLNKKNRAFPQKIFAESVQLEFEGRWFNCPREYDYYLSHCFGNYRQLPPEDKRSRANSGVIYSLK